MGVGLIRFLGSVLQKDTQPNAHSAEGWLFNPRRGKDGENIIDTIEQINIKFGNVADAYVEQMRIDVANGDFLQDDVEFIVEVSNMLGETLVELFGGTDDYEPTAEDIAHEQTFPIHEELHEEIDDVIKNEKITDDLAWVADEEQV
jgi:hypothetical protein